MQKSKGKWQALLLPILALNIQFAQGENQEPGIEEILVIGQKITRSLQDTPTSLGVITSLQMEQKNIATFGDSLIETANSHTTAFGGFSIRGIDGFSVSGGGNSYLASVYVDGAALPSEMIFGGSFSTWDAQQVEIFRGPQSTLQGRNSLAGAVMMTTLAPTQEWQGRYRLQIGEEGKKEAAIAFGASESSGQIAFRFSAETKELEGENKNISRNEPSNYIEDQTYRFKLLFSPTALPNLTALATLTHIDHVRGTPRIEIVEDSNPFKNRVVQNNDKREQFIDADMAVIKFDYQLNENWDLTSLSTWSKVDSGYIWDVDYLPARGNEYNPDTGSKSNYENLAKTISHELRFVFNYLNLNGVVGVYYSDASVDDLQTGLSNFQIEQLGLTSIFLQASYGLNSPIADLVISQYEGFNPARTRVIADSFLNVSSAAIFVDFSWKVNKHWDIFGGLRWDSENQENENSGSYTILNNDQLPNPSRFLGTPYENIVPLISGINDLLYNFAEDSSQVTPQNDGEFETLLPKLGVSYHITDNLTTSFSIQEGYRSGGVGINGVRATAYKYDPEFTTNYELSLRSSWLAGNLLVNANAFYIDWKDQQVDVQLSTNTYDSETNNAGSSAVQGFELDVIYQYTDSMQFYLSLGQARSKFEDFSVVVPTTEQDVVYNLSGRSFAGAPEWTKNIGMIYSNDHGIFVNASVNYADASLADVNPYLNGLTEVDKYFDPKNESRIIANMQIGYEWNNVGVYLIARNIFDEKYLSATSIRTPALGESRHLSLSLRSRF